MMMYEDPEIWGVFGLRNEVVYLLTAHFLYLVCGMK